jgi:hypothetical protein
MFCRHLTWTTTMKATLRWPTGIPASVPEGTPHHDRPPQKQDRATKAAYYFMMSMLVIALLFFMLLPFFI